MVKKKKKNDHLCINIQLNVQIFLEFTLIMLSIYPKFTLLHTNFLKNFLDIPK